MHYARLPHACPGTLDFLVVNAVNIHLIQACSDIAKSGHGKDGTQGLCLGDRVYASTLNTDDLVYRAHVGLCSAAAGIQFMLRLPVGVLCPDFQVVRRCNVRTKDPHTRAIRRMQVTGIGVDGPVPVEKDTSLISS